MKTYLLHLCIFFSKGSNVGIVLLPGLPEKETTYFIYFINSTLQWMTSMKCLGFRGKVQKTTPVLLLKIAWSSICEQQCR